MLLCSCVIYGGAKSMLWPIDVVVVGSIQNKCYHYPANALSTAMTGALEEWILVSGVSLR